MRRKDLKLGTKVLLRNGKMYFVVSRNLNDILIQENGCDECSVYGYDNKLKHNNSNYDVMEIYLPKCQFGKKSEMKINEWVKI